MKKDERWHWVYSTPLNKITDKHIPLTLALNKKPCKTGNCKGCRINPYCLGNAEEQRWITGYKEIESNSSSDEQAASPDGDCLVNKDVDDSPSDTSIKENGTAVAYRGLKNYGNTCYMNALIQIYFRMHDLRAAIYAIPSEIDDVGILAELQTIFGELQIGIGESVEPFGLVQALNLPELEQQDAPEFHSLFINLLDNRFKLLNEFIIRNLLFGEIIYQTRCLNCQYTSDRPSEFQELDLKIEKGNLIDCIEDFFKVESLTGDNQYQCYPCGNIKRDGERRTILKSLPPLLSIQLLRFSYDLKSGRKKKNSVNVNIPEILDMSPFMSNSSGRVCDRYVLKALLLHIGTESSSGHYITLVRDNSLDWIYCNDSCAFVIPQSNFNLSKVTPTMSPTSQSKPLKRSTAGNDGCSSQPESKHWNPYADCTHSSKTAYMVFYERESQFVNRMKRGSTVDVPLYLSVQIEERNAFLRKRQEEKHIEEVFKAERSKEECRKMFSIINLLRADDTSIDLEFLPTQWYFQFLKVGLFEAKPLIEWPSKVICVHGKLSPYANISELRVVSKAGVDKLAEENLVVNRMPVSSICFDCILWKARLLKFKQESMQICKEIDQYYKANRNNNAISRCENDRVYYWIGKDTSKSWRGIVKRNIDRFYLSLANQTSDSQNENEDESKVDGNLDEENKEDDDADNDEEDEDTGDLNFNEDIFCSHGCLTLDSSKRRLIPERLWNSIVHLIETYTPADVLNDKIPTSITDSDDESKVNPCVKCQMLNVDYQGTANQQRETLPDLVQPNKRRPQLSWESVNGSSSNATNKFLPDGIDECDTRGPLFLVPSSFLSEWRRFIKRPDESTVPSKINLKSFLCPHTLLMSTPDELNASSECTLLWPHEWIQLSHFYSPDCQPISFHQDEKGDWVTDPDLCNDCYINEMRLKQQYSNERITVRILSQEDFLNDNFIYPSPSKKSKLDLETNSSTILAEDFGVRRSSRTRKLNSDRSLRVSSEMTVRSLKVQIMNLFGITPSDQHLKHNQRDLIDPDETLLDANIRPGDVLFLWSPLPIDWTGHSFDTSVYGSLPAEEPSIEVGFKGSKLLDM